MQQKTLYQIYEMKQIRQMIYTKMTQILFVTNLMAFCGGEREKKWRLKLSVTTKPMRMKRQNEQNIEVNAYTQTNKIIT